MLLKTRSLSIAFILLFTACSAGAAPTTQPLPAIRVADNHRYFVKTDGTPFFWLADTAWGIFNHAAPADADLYLDDRAAKGFTVIQGCVALWDHNRHVNTDGQLPFVNGDPGQINEAYFNNVDSIVSKATAHGLYMAILPFWTKGYTTTRSADTAGNPEKMKNYCKFLTNRYAKMNIFWILGGDTPGQNIQALVDAEAAGLQEGAKEAGVDKILISYHPTGRQSSSFWFHDRPWLDFNSIQSGHFINTTNFQLVGNDFAKTPVKPTLDMEPGYENITDRLVRNNPKAPRIQAVDVRRSAYLAVFAGAAGHTYGQGEVYDFWSPGTVPPAAWSAAMPWKQALELPASSQVQNVRYLIESRPMLDRIPDQSFIVGDAGTRAVERFAAMRGNDGSYAFVYIPIGKQSVMVQTGKLTGQTLSAWWYDPRTGKATHIDDAPKADKREFTLPTLDDWVLVVDDASKQYPAPGRRIPTN
jgi:hypothetical protein